MGTVTLKEPMILRRHCKSRDQELQKGMIKCNLTLQQVTNMYKFYPFEERRVVALHLIPRPSPSGLGMRLGG